jgi:glycosyltransferase involved in cell wall biosynthesis
MFSIACIARNEARTLPRLLKSLEEFRDRGGEVVLVDTGSTDETVDVALEWGCQVHEVGDRFAFSITAETASAANALVAWDGLPPIVGVGERVFDFAAARNHAAEMCPSDCYGMVDCDEVLARFNVPAVERLFRSGVDIVFNEHVYSWKADGTPHERFVRDTFGRRGRTRWYGIVHEVLMPAPIGSERVDRVMAESALLTEHYQVESANRGCYMPGLALDHLLDPANARKKFYFGRELYFVDHHEAAIRELEEYLLMPGAWEWEMERARVVIAECRRILGAR